MQPLESRAADLRSKLSVVDTKLRAMSKEAAEIEKALQSLGKPEKTEATVTIKQAIIEVLGKAPSGLTAREVFAAINERFFEETLARTSMSPQLTSLVKGGHRVRRWGDHYFLA